MSSPNSVQVTRRVTEALSQSLVNHTMSEFRFPRPSSLLLRVPVVVLARPICPAHHVYRRDHDTRKATHGGRSISSTVSRVYSPYGTAADAASSLTGGGRPRPESSTTVHMHLRPLSRPWMGTLKRRMY
jgi:hypothetical protein